MQRYKISNRLCACGCGLRTMFRSESGRGLKAGEPCIWRQGHQQRVYRPNHWNGHTPEYFRRKA